MTENHNEQILDEIATGLDIEDMPEDQEEEIKKVELVENEDAILAGLLEALDFEVNEELQEIIEIVRNDKVLYSFRIHPVSEKTYDYVIDKNTKYQRSRTTGVKVAVSQDEARMKAQIIFEATIPEDQEKIWKNKKAWKKANCVDPISFIEKATLVGERAKIVDLIDKISGFNNEKINRDKEIETLKN